MQRKLSLRVLVSLARSLLCLWRPAKSAEHNCNAITTMGGHCMSAVQEASAACSVSDAAEQACAPRARVLLPSSFGVSDNLSAAQ